MFGSIRTVRTRRMAIPALGVAAALVIGACTAPQAAPALLTEAMRAYQADGVEYAQLEVDTKNPSGAHDLYASLGYRQTHMSRTYTIEL